MNTTNLTTKADIVPDSITFFGPNTWVLKITADRRIEVNKDVEVPDAAQAIFDALELFWRKKPWVRLTDDEAAACWSTSAVNTCKAIENKLKEKNA